MNANPMERLKEMLVRVERDVARAIEVANGSPLTTQEQCKSLEER